MHVEIERWTVAGLNCQSPVIPGFISNAVVVEFVAIDFVHWVRPWTDQAHLPRSTFQS